MTTDPSFSEASREEANISGLELAIVLAKHKLLIVTITLGAALLSAVVSLALPNVYTGIAKLLPPQQNQSAAAMLLGQLGGLAPLAGNSLGIKNPNDIYVGMLKSRTVADNLIARFNLEKLYETNTMVQTRQELEERSTITAGKDGLISIEYDDEDPKRAAAIANAYVEELQKLSQSLAVTEAAQRRLFFERQVKQAKDDLAKAELAMKLIQEKTGLIKLDDQGKAIIEAVATLRARIVAKEVELRAMRTFATDNNADIVRGEQELSGLRGELRKLERAQIAGGGDVLLPTGRVPEAGLEYMRGLRNVKYYETVFELLARQFELAKIDEAKDSALIQVVDMATPPDRKSKPKRALIVVVMTLLGALLALLVTFIHETMYRARRDPFQAAKLKELRNYVSLRPKKQ
jgi:tyrosine-protein kinase Etk/Wzc